MTSTSEMAGTGEPDMYSGGGVYGFSAGDFGRFLGMDLPSPGSTPGTVLVIEDSPAVQHLIKASLAPLRVTILQALDGEAGLELARDHLPDVILLDIGLPGIDGWGVLTELRARFETAQIAVIVVTAHAQQDAIDTAEQFGVDGFIPKPFRPADLLVQVEDLLGGVVDTASTG